MIKGLRPVGFSASSELEPQKLEELRQGDVFVAHVPGDGRLIGMIGSNETHRLIIILGSERTTLDELQVGWFHPETTANALAYKIDDARLEIVRNARGYAETVDAPENGCVTLDASGGAWVYTRNEKSTVSFNLVSGEAGTPAPPRRYYRDWRIVWLPPESEVPAVLLCHEGTRA